jgi:glycosyltransferase involved in cell wall biosynthesis
MKILCINTLYNGGGAEKIARQVYNDVKSDEIETYFLAGRYQKNISKSIDVIYNSPLGRFASGIVGIANHNFLFGTFYARKKIIEIIKRENIDIVHFHNIHGNYLGPKDIRAISRYCHNIILTMHDMWLITGCCPYGMSCSRWKVGNDCRKCKGNESLHKGTIRASLYLKCKKNNLQNKNFYFVSPSRWLIECCKESYLKDEDIRLIPNGIDTDIYVTHDKNRMRDKYGIPENKNVLLFSANTISSPYKGYQYLYEALNIIEKKDDYCLVVLGIVDEKTLDSTYEVFKRGYISDENTMSELYSAADIYIMPSMADNAPLSCMEAMASGTPVLAFATGGISEIVNDDVGWLTSAGDSRKLAERISEIFNNPEELRRKAMNCRQYVSDNFSKDTMVERYRELYMDIMGESENE